VQAHHGPLDDLLVLAVVIAHARTFAGEGRIVENGENNGLSVPCSCMFLQKRQPLPRYAGSVI
jgi:hypothetical protein